MVLSTLPRPGSKCCPLPRPGSSTTAMQAPPLVAAHGLTAALRTSRIPHHPHTHHHTPRKARGHPKPRQQSPHTDGEHALPPESQQEHRLPPSSLPGRHTSSSVTLNKGTLDILFPEPLQRSQSRLEMKCQGMAREGTRAVGAPGAALGTDSAGPSTRQGGQLLSLQTRPGSPGRKQLGTNWQHPS